jgi:hypothetical protein
MSYRDRQGFMQGMNMYVPAMQWAASIDMGACNTFSLGKPALASATAVATAQVTNGAANSVAFLATPWVSDVPYGRPIVCTPSGSVTATVEVLGEDYLGQPMVERFAWSAVATAVVGKKAFYRVLGMRTVVPGGAITVNIGTAANNNLGLPFKGSIEWAKEANALIAVASPGANWLAPDLTDPATALSGDPRGQYIATAAFDGIKEFVIGLRADSSMNANNNGGLHGIRQFAA